MSGKGTENNGTDPEFEFSAPKFFDFNEMNESVDDTWFANRKSSIGKDNEGTKEASPEGIVDPDDVDPNSGSPVDFTGTKKTLSFVSPTESVKSTARVTRSSTKKAAAVAKTVPSAVKRPANLATASFSRPSKRRKTQDGSTDIYSKLASADTESTRARREADKKKAEAEAEFKKQQAAKKKRLAAQKANPAQIARLMEPTSSRGRKGAKSTEDMIVEKMEKERTRVAKRRRLNEETKKNALEPKASWRPARSTRPLTAPTAFKFRTDSRIKRSHPMKTRSMEKKQPRRARIQREQRRPQTARPMITEPKPFSFSTRQRARTDFTKGDSSPFESMVNKVKKFQVKTPKRFHTRSKTAQATPPPSFDLSLTKPEEPKLRAQGRQRPKTALSREEEEEKIAQEISDHKFKARPFRKEIQESAGDYGVPRVAKKSLTTAKTPKFKSDARIAKYHERHVDDAETDGEDVYVFKAQPVPNMKSKPRMRRGPTKALTVPKTPNFKKAPKARKTEIVEEPKYVFKARPIPDAGSMNKGGHRPMTRSLTRPEPFKLQTDVRGDLAKAHDDERLHEVEQSARKARNFRARPMPVGSPMKPDLGEVKVTAPEPFNLQTDKRGEEYVAHFMDEYEEHLAAEEQAFSGFKARPIPREVDSPFVPEKSSRPLTEVAQFDLNTETRSMGRKRFEERKAREAREAKRLADIAHKEKKESEAMHLKELRESMVHKARPVMKGKSVSIKPSKKKLTNPKTPNFVRRTRARAIRA